MVSSSCHCSRSLLYLKVFQKWQKVPYMYHEYFNDVKIGTSGHLAKESCMIDSRPGNGSLPFVVSLTNCRAAGVWTLDHHWQDLPKLGYLTGDRAKRLHDAMCRDIAWRQMLRSGSSGYQVPDVTAASIRTWAWFTVVSPHPSTLLCCSQSMKRKTSKVL